MLACSLSKVFTATDEGQLQQLAGLKEIYKTDAGMKVSLQILKHFSPCLHYFFLEKFRSPATWYERRLAYTRSTAVNSMAGIILFRFTYAMP